jgi:hypothetical protein
MCYDIFKRKEREPNVFREAKHNTKIKGGV